MEQFREPFSNIKRTYDGSCSSRDMDLLCKQGYSGICPVLKLQKVSWTNPGLFDFPSNIGIFFSVWLDSKSFEKGRVLYNIHALRIGKIEGYSFNGFDFAASFRSEFADLSHSWPHVSVNFGKLTLMQGWIKLDMSTIEQDVAVLFENFLPVSHIIDKLLADRRMPIKAGSSATI